MRLLKIFLFCILLCSVGSFIIKDNDKDTNAKVKVFFIYNFTKYIKWPASNQKGDFIIAIFGNYSTLVKEFKTMATLRKVGKQSITVHNYNSVTEIQNCHILYIVEAKSSQLGSILNKVKSMNILLITDHEGLINKGAGINMFNFQNKQKFELNKTNINKYNLTVDDKLLSLASKVYK